MTYTDGAIKMSPDTWQSSAVPTKAGSSTSDDLANTLNGALTSFFGSLNTVSFINSSKNLLTALEDFGTGLAGALACVGVDLLVVGTGLAAAATAFAATDAALASTFAQLETQLGYYTNTTLQAGAGWTAPTAAAQSALNGLTLSSSANSSAASTSLSTTTLHFSVQDGVVVGVTAGVIIAAAVIDWAAVGTAVGSFLAEYGWLAIFAA